MTKLEELQAKLNEKLAENAKIVSEAIETHKIVAKLDMLDNKALTVARVNASIKAEVSAKLDMLNTQCEQIVASMPIYSVKTKQDRKWNPSKQYGLGNQLATLTGILSGIMYSASEHKQQLLALTGLSEDIIESTLEAFGSPAYYSKNYGLVVDAQPYSLDEILSNIGLIEQALDITIDKSKLTSTVLDNRFKSARVRAELELTQAQKTAALAQEAIVVE